MDSRTEMDRPEALATQQPPAGLAADRNRQSPQANTESKPAPGTDRVSIDPMRSTDRYRLVPPQNLGL